MTVPHLANTPRSTRSCTGERGFTLVEILVATTMLALLMGLLFATLHTAVRAWDRAEQYSVEANDIEAVQRFLRGRIAAARPAVHPDDALGILTPDTRVTFIGERERLSFVAPLPAFRGTGGLYLFVLHAGDGELVLSYRPFHPRMPTLQPGIAHPWVSQTLLSGVREIGFRYLGQPNAEVPYGWHTIWPEPTQLPFLVEISVARQDPIAIPWPVLAARPTVERTGGRGQTSVDFGGR